jgi:hypothetical protein
MSNKMIKKATACTLSAVMAFGLVAVIEAPKTANVSAATKKVKKLSFKKKGYVISVPGHWMNAKTRLKFSPKSAKTYKLKYKTSNKKIATISKNGIIRAKKKGTVTITAIAKNNKKAKATMTLTVGKVVKTLKFKEGTKKTVTAGSKFTLHPTYKPKDAATKAVTWKSSNTKVATVSSKGKVTTKKDGTVTITATAKDAGKKKATFKVTVKKKAVTPAKPTTETLIPVATGNGKVKLSGIDPKASQYVLKYKDNSVTISAKEAKEALGYLDNPESGYQAWVNTSYREKGFVSVSGKGNTKTVTLTANTKYAGKYEVTITKVAVGKEYKVHAERKATGGTRDITVTVNNGVVTAKNDKTGVEYTAQKENGKYSIELPESIGNNVTIIQTVAK